MLFAASPDPTSVSPGFAGFLTIFVLALVTILLIRSMVGHLRKVRYGKPPGDDEPRDHSDPGASPRA